MDEKSVCLNEATPNRAKTMAVTTQLNKHLLACFGCLDNRSRPVDIITPELYIYVYIRVGLWEWKKSI